MISLCISAFFLKNNSIYLLLANLLININLIYYETWKPNFYYYNCLQSVVR